jgi:hypothetical protein
VAAGRGVDAEDRIETKIKRWHDAAQLLENPLLNEAFDALTAAYIEQWKLTRFNDTDGRDRLWQAVNCIGKVRDHFRLMCEDGKIAQAQLNDMQGLGKTR